MYNLRRMKRSRQVASRRVASRRVKWFLEATQASTRLWLWLWPPHPQDDDDDDDDEQDLAGVAMARITSISLLLPLAILSSFLLVATWFLFSPASAGDLQRRLSLHVFVSCFTSCCCCCCCWVLGIVSWIKSGSLHTYVWICIANPTPQ